MLLKMDTAITTEVGIFMRDSLSNIFFTFHSNCQNRNGRVIKAPTEVQSRNLSRTNRMCSNIHQTGIISASTAPPVRESLRRPTRSCPRINELGMRTCDIGKGAETGKSLPRWRFYAWLMRRLNVPVCGIGGESWGR